MLKIYRIVDNTNGNIYIGKTIRTLKERLKEHESKKSKSVSRDIINNGDYRIELIEETDDINRERYWILNTECINKNIPSIVNPDIKKIIKIYRIIDNTNGNTYIGKTTQTLKERLRGHRRHLDCVVSEIIKNGDYQMELIEETYDPSRERYWIENTECINKQIPGRTDKEYREANKERRKQYLEDKKEYIKLQRAEYGRKNRESIIKKGKKYYNENRDTISKKKKKKNQKNKSMLQQKSRDFHNENRETINKKNLDKYYYKSSWGGDPRSNNNLLEIDPNLFF